MTRTIITPPTRINLPSFSELWRARDIFYRFSQRDIVLRYRQTVVGVAWVVIQPLLSAGIFSVIFGQVAGLPSDGIPYFLFSFAGMLVWNIFNGIVSRASGSLVANQALISKVFFPRLLVPLSNVTAVLLDFAVAFVLFIVLLFAFGVNPGWAILALPVWIVCAMLLALGIGLAASAITVRYRDVGYILPWVLQLLLYATPIAYSLSAAPADLRWIFDINPLTWLMEASRWSLLGTSLPPAWQLVALPVVSVVAALLGLLVFQKFEREFADVV